MTRLGYENLRDYQQQDVDKCVAAKTMAIFSEQRTGKTPVACVTLDRLAVNRPLIVCPASMVYVWKREYELWTGRPAKVLETTTFTKLDWKEPCALIVNYEKIRGTLKDDGRLARELVKAKPEAVVLDEAHRMKSRTSLTTIALKLFKSVPIKLALTGTPAPNKPWDVWTILNWTYGRTYSSYWDFMDEYFDIPQSFFGNQVNESIFKPGKEDALANKLKAITIQHKRKEVMHWVEEITPTIVKLPCSNLQSKVIAELETVFEYKNIVTRNTLENLIRIRQICAHPGILGLKGKSPKVEWLKQYIKDYPEKHIIVFSNSAKFLDLIFFKEDLGTSKMLVCGHVKQPDRLDIFNRFQNGDVQVLLLQTQTGKEGLTLDNADVTIFLDTSPPASDYAQAKDRMVATLESNVKPKELIHVMMQDTYDARLYDLVSNNISDTEVVNDYTNYLHERSNTNGKSN